MNFYPNGFVIYSPVSFDEYGTALEKSCERGFAWILKEGKFDPENLFRTKNQIRCLSDPELVKEYITECINYGIPWDLYFIFSEDASPCPIGDSVRQKGTFLGYDYINPSADISPLYEAKQGIYRDTNPEFHKFIEENTNKYSYFSTEEQIDRFIRERENIFSDFCNLFITEEISIIPEKTVSEKKTKSFFKAEIWKADIKDYIL
ncbi:MAG: hypothetical protein KBT47_08520 [Armatimonadetes bacterium]|nr:hypothetical protein [Candidatus Hippobium faecium]